MSDIYFRIPEYIRVPNFLRRGDELDILKPIEAGKHSNALKRYAAAVTIGLVAVLATVRWYTPFMRITVGFMFVATAVLVFLYFTERSEINEWRKGRDEDGGQS